jgi:hypothetical protein
MEEKLGEKGVVGEAWLLDSLCKNNVSDMEILGDGN